MNFYFFPFSFFQTCPGLNGTPQLAFFSSTGSRLKDSEYAIAPGEQNFFATPPSLLTLIRKRGHFLSRHYSIKSWSKNQGPPAPERILTPNLPTGPSPPIQPQLEGEKRPFFIFWSAVPSGFFPPGERLSSLFPEPYPFRNFLICTSAFYQIFPLPIFFFSRELSQYFNFFSTHGPTPRKTYYELSQLGSETLCANFEHIFEPPSEPGRAHVVNSLTPPSIPHRLNSSAFYIVPKMRKFIFYQDSPLTWSTSFSAGPVRKTLVSHAPTMPPFGAISRTRIQLFLRSSPSFRLTHPLGRLFRFRLAILDCFVVSFL